MPVSYSQFFYEEMEDASLASAREIVPYVMSLISPHSVVDVGCAEGIWLSVFKENGVSAIRGIDGNWVDKNKLRIPVEYFTAKDLEKPLKLEVKADLAICLEIAEHLPSSRADLFIADLTVIAPVVLFSAAIPLQGGSRHINEQWPDYWENFFAKYGYMPVDCLRRVFWNNKNVSFFYSQNLLIYVKKSELDKYPKLKSEIAAGNDRALPLVHPKMYLYYGERWRMLMPYLGKIPPSILHGVKRVLSRLTRR